jgi:ParB-like chromosome segregation protein Spo0J
MKVMNLAALVLDPRLQSRVEINEDTVAEYAADIEAGDQFPPVIVFFDSTHFYLADGYHRYYGHKRAGKVSIQCEVINGTIRDAIYYSTAVNAKHGMRRSYADRRKAVMILLDDFEWSLKSNTEIAKHVGVSISFVSNLRSTNGKTPEKVQYTTPSGEVKTREKNTGRPAKVKEELLKEEPVAAEPENKFGAHDELIETLTKENAELTQQLAVSGMEGTEEEKQAASELISSLTEQLRIAEIEIVSLKGSRDRFQNECAQLKKQVAAQQRQLKKYEQ